MKIKSLFTCSKCGFESPKWVGKCPGCDEWNSFTEAEIQEPSVRAHKSVGHKSIKPKTPVSLISTSNVEKRLVLKMNEVNRVLGGGLIEGSLSLLTGEPGIGKSTLTLQLCNDLLSLNKSVLYVSGEESQNQIASRAQRLKINSENLSFLSETSLETIIATLNEFKPNIVIIDSIQVLNSADLTGLSGSIGQIRYATEQFMEFAKTTNTPIILIGHVTKEGDLAGPRVLEHLVDTVLFLEGDRYQNFRILRSQKNRFGSTNEIGIFEMNENGMVEVANPSAHFLEGRKENPIGSAITVTMEGTRPILVETQGLTNITPFGYPKRTATGYDINRLQLLISVLQKYARFNLSNQDVFVNVVGGMRLNDPACDLGVLVAIASSYMQKVVPSDTVFIGEIGLSGEIRNVSQLSKRVKEAEKLGFKTIVVPHTKEKITTTSGKNLIKTKDIFEVVKAL
ncbi:DNA repair protein RadA [Candidatus Peregrinibacteria bacterium]|nr:DNA repair protein RadA [Candidatus Peregrinibacteria bacterium]